MNQKFSKPDDIDVDPNKPWDGDDLNRKSFGINLAHILARSESPLVVSIDGSWGSGKTTFLKRFQHHLKAERFQTVNFNAWENDFTRDPLIPLAYVISEALQPNSGTMSKAGKAFKAATTEAAHVTAEKLSDYLLKAVSLGQLGYADAQRIAAAAESSCTQEEPMRAELPDEFEKYQKQKEALDSFRSALADYFQEHCARVDKDVSGDNPKDGDLDTNKLVIIIDELDRCRPTWAVEALERIKHLLSIPGIVFVIATDTDQLSEAVRAVYGPGYDGVRYLGRFFDIRTALPCNHKTLRGAIDRIAMNSNIPVRVSKLLTCSAESNNLDIRTTLQLLSRITVFQSWDLNELASTGFHRDELLVSGAVLLILYECDRNLYFSIRRGESKTEEIVNAMYKPGSCSKDYAKDWEVQAKEQVPPLVTAVARIGDKGYYSRYIQQSLAGASISEHITKDIADQISPLLYCGGEQFRQHLFDVVEFANTIHS